MGGRPLPREELETVVVGEDFQVLLGERRRGDVWFEGGCFGSRQGIAV